MLAKGKLTVAQFITQMAAKTVEMEEGVNAECTPSDDEDPMEPAMCMVYQDVPPLLMLSACCHKRVVCVRFINCISPGSQCPGCGVLVSVA